MSGKVDPSVIAVSKKVDSAFSKMTKTAKTVTLAGVSAGAATATAAVKVGASFESQMSTVKAISGATGQEFEALEAKAKEMGATTKFTATESGQAMEYMAMAGWKSKEMIDGIDGIMDLAAASGENLATTSDIVTDALTAFNLKAGDSGRFSDVLAAASSNSNTNVAMMGETFKYVASVAGSLGYSIEDSAVSIGLLANAGIKSSQAGTTLRRIMSETAGGIHLVSKAYAKAGEKTGEYEIETANADGSMKDWSVTVGKLREEFSKMTEQEQAANAESIAGKTGMAGLLAIVNASEKDYKKLTKSIKNSKGAAEDMSNIRLDNLEGDFKIFESALEGKGIDLYKEIKEPLREIVQDATDWIEDVDVAAVVDEFEDFGEGVLDFAEPLIDVGKWLIDNPDILGGAITTMGSALTASKVVTTLPKVTDSIELFRSAVTSNPMIAGATLTAGAIVGVGTAVHIANERARKSSLDEHFGDIALSMEQIEDAASKIVGSNKLKGVGELIDSIEISDGLVDDMEKATREIDQMDWKISVGLKVSEDDTSSYKKSVEGYLEDAQDLIEQEGYTVTVAAEILFGDSKDGKDFVKNSDNFIKAMETETTKLSKKINKSLEKAMKDGLTTDLSDEINGYMSQISEITTAMTEAESEASWETLAADFSGKELDADSFGELQDEVNKNIEKINEGAESAYNEAVTNLLAQKKLGYIDDKTYETQKNKAQEALKNTTETAKNNGLEFQYNTLMDTYGENIASGEYGFGDKSAIQGIIYQMEDEATGEIKDRLAVIKEAVSGNFVTDAFDTATEAMGGGTPASDKIAAQNEASRYALAYINGTEIETESSNVGMDAANSLKNSFEKVMNTGINANAPINLTGKYTISATTDAPITETTPKGSSSKVTVPELPGHAIGTISDKEHVARVSEGNRREAIIPINKSKRSRQLYDMTGKLMGLSSAGVSVTFSPTIQVPVQGSVSPGDKREIEKIVGKQLKTQYNRMLTDFKRVNMRGH